MRKLSFFDLFYLVLVASAAAILVIFFPLARKDATGFTVVLLVSSLIIACFSAVAEVYGASKRVYFLALAAHLVCTLILLSLSRPFLFLQLPIVIAYMSGVCFHNPYPVNLALGGGSGLLFILLRLSAPAADAAGEASGWADHAAFGIIILFLILFGGFMVRYRESLIDCQEENQRLDALVERLTRANLSYQEYAKTVQENSIEHERKRITRDIHDIVGYTLTNNITMMEAVTDMMRVNPLGVATLVNLARENAEEGLARIREALHILRSHEIIQPTGLHAVLRLIQVFKRATGVQVDFSYTEGLWKFSDEVDFALYHVVQESLMNAFRHGKATDIQIFLRREETKIDLKIRDNGQGGGQYTDGIGISGMRERVEAVKGTLAVRSAVDGFEVRATIPAKEDQT